MKHNCTHLIEDVSVCSVHRLKVDGFSVTKSTINNKKDCRIKSRCSVDGHDWEIQFRTAPYKVRVDEYWVALELVYLGGGAPSDDDGVAVYLSCRLLHESSDLVPLASLDMTKFVVFKRPMDRSPPIYLGRGKVRDDVQAPPGFQIKGGSFTVECTINVRSRRDPN